MRASTSRALSSSDKHAKWCNTRRAQVENLLSTKCDHLLSSSEIFDASRLCCAALDAYLAEPTAVDEKTLGSAACWAVLLTQAVAARRPGGWAVDTEEAAAAWDARIIHAGIADFKSEHFTDGGEQSATLVGGRSGLGAADAAAVSWLGGTTAASHRRLRLDALGDDAALKAKARTLHWLLESAGRDGLPAPILDLEQPRVLSFSAAHAARKARDDRVRGWAASVRSREEAARQQRRTLAPATAAAIRSLRLT